MEYVTHSANILNKNIENPYTAPKLYSLIMPHNILAGLRPPFLASERGLLCPFLDVYPTVYIVGRPLFVQRGLAAIDPAKRLSHSTQG